MQEAVQELKSHFELTMSIMEKYCLLLVQSYSLSRSLPWTSGDMFFNFSTKADSVSDDGMNRSLMYVIGTSCYLQHTSAKFIYQRIHQFIYQFIYFCATIPLTAELLAVNEGSHPSLSYCSIFELRL